jgi:tRNA(Ile)-lysidine synthase
MNAVSGILVRPLLPFSRVDIAEWLATLGAEIWEDPANIDPRHLRSWLRTEILPRLRPMIPEVDQRLQRVARLARTDRLAWDALLDILPLDLQVEAGGVSLRHAPLSDWPRPLGMQLLQAAARRAGFTLGPLAASRVLALVGQGRSGRRADLGRGLVAECAFDRVSLGPPHPAAPMYAAISGAQGTVEAGAWRCQWRPDPAPERQARAGWVAWLPPGEYTVRPWNAGDRIVPLGGVGSRLVVRCMQEARIPRRERSAWPVVTAGGEILWVPGITRSNRGLPAAGSPALRLEFSRR